MPDPQPISRLLLEASTPVVTDPSETLAKRVLKHNWRFEPFHPELSTVLDTVKRFCTDVLRHKEPYWLTLLGPSGIGKTLLLKQAFKILDAGGDGWPIPLHDGRGSERRATCAHIVPAKDLEDYRSPRYYAGLDLVYVEDIGSGVGLEKGAGAVLRSRVAELLQLRSLKWTMLCANLSRTEISQQIDGRIASRLKRDGSRLFEFSRNVPDFSDLSR